MKRCAKWILECDIKSCFDEISHDWLLRNIPMDKIILKQWLKADYIEQLQLNAKNLGFRKEESLTIMPKEVREKIIRSYKLGVGNR